MACLHSRPKLSDATSTRTRGLCLRGAYFVLLAADLAETDVEAGTQVWEPETPEDVDTPPDVLVGWSVPQRPLELTVLSLEGLAVALLGLGVLGAVALLPALLTWQVTGIAASFWWAFAGTFVALFALALFLLGRLLHRFWPRGRVELRAEGIRMPSFRPFPSSHIGDVLSYDDLERAELICWGGWDYYYLLRLWVRSPKGKVKKLWPIPVPTFQGLSRFSGVLNFADIAVPTKVSRWAWVWLLWPCLLGAAMIATVLLRTQNGHVRNDDADAILLGFGIFLPFLSAMRLPAWNRWRAQAKRARPEDYHIRRMEKAVGRLKSVRAIAVEPVQISHIPWGPEKAELAFGWLFTNREKLLEADVRGLLLDVLGVLRRTGLKGCKGVLFSVATRWWDGSAHKEMMMVAAEGRLDEAYELLSRDMLATADGPHGHEIGVEFYDNDPKDFGIYPKRPAEA